LSTDSSVLPTCNCRRNLGWPRHIKCFFFLVPPARLATLWLRQPLVSPAEFLSPLSPQHQCTVIITSLFSFSCFFAATFVNSYSPCTHSSVGERYGLILAQVAHRVCAEVASNASRSPLPLLLSSFPSVSLRGTVSRRFSIGEFFLVIPPASASVPPLTVIS